MGGPFRSDVENIYTAYPVTKGDVCCSVLKPRGTLEFTQTYNRNRKVIKRGINASVIEVRKKSIPADSFQTYVSRISNETAFTAFHFHPEYPIDKREALMMANRDGLELLKSKSHPFKLTRMGGFYLDRCRGFARQMMTAMSINRLIQTSKNSK